MLWIFRNNSLINFWMLHVYEYFVALLTIHQHFVHCLYRLRKENATFGTTLAFSGNLIIVLCTLLFDAITFFFIRLDTLDTFLYTLDTCFFSVKQCTQVFYLQASYNLTSLAQIGFVQVNKTILLGYFINFLCSNFSFRLVSLIAEQNWEQ